MNSSRCEAVVVDLELDHLRRAQQATRDDDGEGDIVTCYDSGVASTILAVYPVLSVKDVPKALAFYELLGFRTRFVDDDGNPRYGGTVRDGVELHVQWHDVAEWSYPVDRPALRFRVDDVDALSAELALEPPLDRTAVMDTSWGTREFHVRDIDGNVLQFFRPR